MSDMEQGTQRRPIANIFRTTAHKATDWCVKRKIHPNWISYASIVFAGSAAVCFVVSPQLPMLLLVACLLCIARLWCNMLDGMVAIAGNSTSRIGEIVNEFPDRISDVLIFVGVAHTPWCEPIIGYWAAIMSLLTAYTGILGQAVGAQREFSGTMSKPWRMAIIIFAATGFFFFPTLNRYLVDAGLPQIMSIACLVVIVGCIQSIFVRLRNTIRSISNSQPTGDNS